MPRDLLRVVTRINPYFRGYGQHDAQELLRCVLDNIHEGQALRVKYEYNIEEKHDDDDEDEPRSNDQAEEDKKEGAEKKPKPPKYYEPASIISEVFQGPASDSRDSLLDPTDTQTRTYTLTCRSPCQSDHLPDM